MHRITFLFLFILLGACGDVSPQDTFAPATEIDIRSLHAGTPVRTDDCGADPGFVLTEDEVLIPDICLPQVSNIDGCFVRLADDVIEVPELEIWCDFDCNGEGLEIGLVLADFPDEGVDHHTIENPCPELAQ